MTTSEQNKTIAEFRDRVVGDVEAYAAKEHLTERGKVQAAVRLGAEAAFASTPSPAQPTCGATISSPHKVCEQVSGHVGMHGRPGYFWASPAQPTEANEREALAGIVQKVIEQDVHYDDGDWSMLADAILAAGFHLAPSPVQGADDETITLSPGMSAAIHAMGRHGAVPVQRDEVQGADDRLAQVEAGMVAFRAYLEASGHDYNRLTPRELNNLLAYKEAFLAGHASNYEQSPQAALNEVRAGAEHSNRIEHEAGEIS